MPPEIEQEVDTPVEQEPVDRRAALEAAFDTASEEEETLEPKLADADPGTSSEVAPPPKPGDTGGAKRETSEADSTGDEPDTKVFSVEKPPQAWRGPQKAKWATLDPDVRQEVVRREREITKTLSESASARHFANNFHQAVQPYMARIQTHGGNPVQAVQNLLAADHLLSTAPKAQRANLMAKLIKDYDVDVAELDSALSGQPRANPQVDEVNRLLQQRLAPLEQFLQTQQQRDQAAKQAQEAQLNQTIEEMASDPAYPYFETVRDTMADIIDIMAKKGKTISLQECYNKAIAMDPQVSAELAAKAEAAKKAEQVAANVTRAQRAKQASVSVSGAPSGIKSGTPAGDRRSIIEAAFEQAAGR